MTQVLHEAHVRCSEAFSALLSISASSLGKDDCQALEAEFDRYKLWADNVGAAHCGRTYKYSLDYRLREASFYKDQVSNFLSVLTSHIDRATEIIDGTRIPFEAEQELEDDDDETEGDDDSMWDPCSDSDIDELLENDTPQTKILGKTFDRLSTTDLSQSSVQSASEIGQILKSITRTVSGLYRLPIRRPAPMDRIRDDATQRTECYQHFDMLHVKSKFPQLNERVATRLGKMITRRRQLLLYRQTHDEHQRAGAKSFKSDGSAQLHSRHMSLEGISDVTSGEGARRSLLSSSQQGSNEMTLRSKATTLRLEGFPPLYDDSSYEPSEVGSRTSIALTEATGKICIEVPSRPTGTSGSALTHFKCSYCSIVVSRISSDRSWKRHVLKDLLPYVCTFPDCELSDHLFDDREEWYTHEAQHHRVNYFCNESEHDEYEDRTAFLAHMRDVHYSKFDNTPQSTKLLRAFRKPKSSLGGVCNLCFQPTESVRDHVSRHLEQLAVFAIPRTDYHGDDEPVQTASDEAIQSRATQSKHSSRSFSFGSNSQADLLARDENIPDARDHHRMDDLDVSSSPSDNLRVFEDDVGETGWGFLPDKLPEAVLACGVVRDRMGNWTRDEKILRRQLSVKEKVLGGDNLEVLRVTANLACVCAETSQYDEAEAFLKQALDGLERKVGSNHKMTLRVAHNLGVVYGRNKKPKDAESIMRPTLDGYTRIFGEDHKETCVVMGYLGIILRRRGKIDEAEELTKEALEVLKRTLGQGFETLQLACWLADLYEKCGKSHKVAILYQMELEDCKRTLEPESSLTLAMANLLGTSYLKLSKHDQAEKVWKEAIETTNNGTGPNFACRRAIAIKLADLYRLEKRDDDAEEVLRWQLEQSLRRGVVDESIHHTLAALSGLYQQQNRLDEALKIYHVVLDRTESLDSVHEGKLELLRQLGILYWTQGNLDQAEAMFQQASRQIRPGDPSVEAVNVLTQLGIFYSRQWRLTESIIAYQKGVELCKKVMPPMPVLLVGTLSDLGRQKWHNQEYDEAEKTFQRAVTESRALFTTSVATISAFDGLATLYETQGRFEEAERTYQLLLDHCKFSIVNCQDTTENPFRLNTTLENVKGLYLDMLDRRQQLYDTNHYWSQIMVSMLGDLLYRKICYCRPWSDQKAQATNKVDRPSNSQDKDLEELINLFVKYPGNSAHLGQLVGRAFLRAGREDEASIVFQHLSAQETSLAMCDGCLHGINVNTERHVCKVCIDSDLCGKCFRRQQGQEEAHARGMCFRHPTFAVPRPRERSSEAADDPIFNKEAFQKWLLKTVQLILDEQHDD